MIPGDPRTDWRSKDFNALTKQLDPEPITIRYETDAMHCMRQRLTAAGYTDEQVDTFKECLIALERQGFTLSGPTK